MIERHPDQLELELPAPMPTTHEDKRRGPFPVDQEDKLLWPDGTWCYRFEVEGYSFMSDDYEVVSYHDQERYLRIS